MDNLTKEQRRKNMQNIRSTGTRPEILIKKELKRRKIYFTQHIKTLPGKPDFVFRRKKVAVFIDSDFWHGNPERFIMPETNKEYWENKINKNKIRDESINKELGKLGWQVIRIWVSDLKNNYNGKINVILTSIGKI